MEVAEEVVPYKEEQEVGLHLHQQWKQALVVVQVEPLEDLEEAVVAVLGHVHHQVASEQVVLTMSGDDQQIARFGEREEVLKPGLEGCSLSG